MNVSSTREFWSGQILRSEEGGGVVGVERGKACTVQVHFVHCAACVPAVGIAKQQALIIKGTVSTSLYGDYGIRKTCQDVEMPL